MTMSGSASAVRGELKKKGGGRLQVIHVFTRTPKRSLFRPILRRRWKWMLSLLLWETEASSAREEEDVGVKDSPSKRAKTVEEPAYPPLVPATALTRDVRELNWCLGPGTTIL
jgi:hypothetical protein